MPIREDHPIKVAVSLFLNPSINFIFLSRMEGEMPLSISVYLHIEFDGINLSKSYKI